MRRVSGRGAPGRVIMTDLTAAENGGASGAWIAVVINARKVDVKLNVTLRSARAAITAGTDATLHATVVKILARILAKNAVKPAKPVAMTRISVKVVSMVQKQLEFVS